MGSRLEQAFHGRGNNMLKLISKHGDQEHSKTLFYKVDHLYILRHSNYSPKYTLKRKLYASV